MNAYRFSWLALLLLTLLPCAAHAAPGDLVFGETHVYAINIDFWQPAYWDSLVYYYNQGLEHYMPATVTIDGTVFDSVGVRLKGNASYTHPNDKKPFRFSFDEFHGDQLWDGLKGVHLNNCWEDPTFIREKLHLDFNHEAGIPGPRGNFAQLSLNGEVWGLYGLEEHVNKTFLGTHYGDNDGNLYKAVDGLMMPVLSDFKWYGDDPSYYLNRYELKTDEPSYPIWTDLIAVIDSINNTADVSAAMPPVINLPSVYRAFAADILLANLDSYVGSCRNFYAYFNPLTTKMEWIVWDAGMSFGSYWSLGTNFEDLSITYVSNAANRPLAGKIFGDPVLCHDYLQTFCELFNEHYSVDGLQARVDELANLVRPYVYADPRKMYTNEQFETNLDSDLAVGGHRKPGLKPFIAARGASVETQLAALGISCEFVIAPGDVAINEFAASNTLILDPAGEAEDWIELYNNTTQTIDLSGLYMTDTASNPTLWQFPAGTTIAPDGYLIVWADEDLDQEGLHADFKLSAGGEFIGFSDLQGAVLDSVTFGAQTANLTMARIPNGTGEFVQGHPTFNGRNGLGVGVVVVNEFAASNTQILDPAGEAEDWVEFYNNSAEAVDLGGMYLSDTESLPTLWQFPAGTTIGANEYLIVWLDDDAGQEGLHASFKLSAGGEYIGFYDQAAALLDGVTFGAQTANLTMARVPNGTGVFVQGPPTFQAFNGYGTIVPAGDVVVNEIMADNDIIEDPAGETDDWLEIYNMTGQAIAMAGLYLSDSQGAPTKWQFPTGTILPANGYLVIWCDEDTGQEGLHAGFKLSADGEDVVLSNADLSVVDQTTFGPQQTNYSLARIPNGSGPFVITPVPTPGAANDDGSSAPDGSPARLALEPNRPDPFHGRTTIDFRIAERGRVAVQLFDLQGRLTRTLVDREMAPGSYRVDFDAAGLPSGVYLCRMRAQGAEQTMRMLLVN